MAVASTPRGRLADPKGFKPSTSAPVGHLPHRDIECERLIAAALPCPQRDNKGSATRDYKLRLGARSAPDEVFMARCWTPHSFAAATVVSIGHLAGSGTKEAP